MSTKKLKYKQPMLNILSSVTIAECINGSNAYDGYSCSPQGNNISVGFNLCRVGASISGGDPNICVTGDTLGSLNHGDTCVGGSADGSTAAYCNIGSVYVSGSCDTGTGGTT
ncbi:MAG TPA: hypothetical protein QF753_03830 [Victivallales bacterium]|nr:hypothetical protein [Victivallales bacterium]